MSYCKGCKFEENMAFDNPCFACKYGNGIEDMRNPIDVIEIPQGATNGDMIVDMFPDLGFEIDELYKRILVINISNYYAPTFPLDWWNAPYKKEVE